jgi:hypothetical protein
MAVLIEALSVVVLVSALERSYPGGVKGYADAAPNRTFCGDGVITRVGFMAPPDVGLFVRRLWNFGIAYMEGDNARDLVVVDQQTGIREPCDWLRFERREFKFGTISVAEHTSLACGPSAFSVSTPIAWNYEDSLSREFSFISNEERKTNLPVRREGGGDIYIQPDGTEKVVARPFAIVKDVPAFPSAARPESDSSRAQRKNRRKFHRENE